MAGYSSTINISTEGAKKFVLFHSFHAHVNSGYLLFTFEVLSQLFNSRFACCRHLTTTNRIDFFIITNLTTQVDLSSLPIVAPPNSFPAILTKL